MVVTHILGMYEFNIAHLLSVFSLNLRAHFRTTIAFSKGTQEIKKDNKMTLPKNTNNNNNNNNNLTSV